MAMTMLTAKRAEKVGMLAKRRRGVMRRERGMSHGTVLAGGAVVGAMAVVTSISFLFLSSFGDVGAIGCTRSSSF
jgi:hypothetical protein